MRIGWLSDNRFKIDANKLQRIRNWTVDKQTLCTNCLARYHCAGGCVVRHNTYLPPGQYDDLCIQTRLITIATLLRKIGQHDLASEWLSSQSAMEAAAIQNTDRLVAMEMTK